MIFRYVLHERINDYLQLGWKLADDLQGTPHGNYSVLMQWDKEGEPIEPTKDRGRLRGNSR